jgi:transketolase
MKFNDNTEQLAVNTIRFLALDMVEQANSGHPGLPLGAAPMAYTLWSKFLKFNPKNPHWPNRDRFVLSAGHGSALLYSLLYLFGYDLPMAELKKFRRLGSLAPGHPESTLTPGIEVTTGPLGQGFGNGVGMAIAERFLATKFNRPGFDIMDHFTYGIVSDGDLMEGVASEAASLAGHLKLGKLIYLYDDNKISLDGPTSMAFTENVPARFEAYGWHTITVADGNDRTAIEKAIMAAQSVTDKPSLISVKTVIGFGSPLEGTNKVHGSAMGAENVKKTKKHLNWPYIEPFYIPEETKTLFDQVVSETSAFEVEWYSLFTDYKLKYPQEHALFGSAFNNELPENWAKDMPVYDSTNNIATRQASGEALNVLKNNMPLLIGGSADLAGSNETPKKEELSFQPEHTENSNIWFGVREHAMGAALVGMNAHGGLRVYGGTFLTFSDYMRGAIRLAALTRARITYIFTHDSIGLGEDGPTHQPIEHFASLRTVPNLTVIRPGDANETVEAWKYAMGEADGPVALILSRQKWPAIDQNVYGNAGHLSKGGYVLKDEGFAPELIIIATGSEVKLALNVQVKLAEEGISSRVVSMPAQRLFDLQDQVYKDSVLTPSVRSRVSIEAGSTFGWHKYVGIDGLAIGIDTFGESGTGEEVMAHFGFTVPAVLEKIKTYLPYQKEF